MWFAPGTGRTNRSASDMSLTNQFRVNLVASSALQVVSVPVIERFLSGEVTGYRGEAADCCCTGVYQGSGGRSRPNRTSPEFLQQRFRFRIRDARRPAMPHP